MIEAVQGGHIFHCNLFTAAAVKLFSSFQEGPLLAWSPSSCLSCQLTSSLSE